MKITRLKLSQLIVIFFGLTFIYVFAFAEDLIYNQTSRRDPFIPLVTAEGRLLKLDKADSNEGLSLEGIAYEQNGGSYAIVNAEVLRVGESIGDSKLLSIGKNNVEFIKNGNKFELRLKEEEEK